MPKGPQGQKRPADVVGAAIKVAKIATGEKEEEIPHGEGKDQSAQILGRKGGKARAKKLSNKERSKIAAKAAKIRWAAKYRGEEEL